MRKLLGMLLALVWLCGHAQAPFDSLELRPVSLPGSPALHSGAFAQWEGRWYFIGGRTNGLHGFLPPLAFPSSGRQEEVHEVDPASGAVRSLDLSVLPVNVFEAVTTSNMQFYQQDSILYLVGGYGWNDSAGTFLTYPTLTRVSLPAVRSALDGTAPLANAFLQLRDSRLAVCGAHLGKVGDTFLLPWGHRFDGMYDRSDTTGFFSQDYTYAIRRFRIVDAGGSLSLADYSSVTDTAEYRRRDYNLVPQVMPTGEFGYTGFTGVFREGIDLPYLNTVDMGLGWQRVVPGFEQMLSQYHSAFAALHDSVGGNMHTLFFGGMSRYFLDSTSGLLTEDSLVPFVSTISLVTRHADSSMTEVALPVRMPALSGTNCYFLPDLSVPQRHHDVLAIDGLDGPTRIGWLYGGITSPEANINSTDPALSWATPEVHEVWLHFNLGVGMEGRAVKAPVSLTIGPNPASGELNVQVEAAGTRPVRIALLDLNGRELGWVHEGICSGKLAFSMDVSGLAQGQYYLKLVSGNFTKVVNVAVAR